MTDATTLESLAAKLESLDLTDAEQAVLDDLFDRAASGGGEVEGYGVVFEVETTYHGGSEIGSKRPPVKVELARGIGLDPASVWTDMRPLS